MFLGRGVPWSTFKASEEAKPGVQEGETGPELESWQRHREKWLVRGS